MTDARDDQPMTNPAFDLVGRGRGRWWGLMAAITGLLLLFSSSAVLAMDQDVAQAFAGLDQLSAFDRVAYAIQELRLVPLGLALTALLVERARMLPLLAVGVWSLAQLLTAINTHDQLSNLPS